MPSRPGSTPAANSLPMLVLVMMPYSTSTMRGGIRMPSVPPAATRRCRGLRVAVTRICGIATLAMVAAVARLEPQTRRSRRRRRWSPSRGRRAGADKRSRPRRGPRTSRRGRRGAHQDEHRDDRVVVAHHRVGGDGADALERRGHPDDPAEAERADEAEREADGNAQEEEREQPDEGEEHRHLRPCPAATGPARAGRSRPTGGEAPPR